MHTGGHGRLHLGLAQLTAFVQPTDADENYDYSDETYDSQHNSNDQSIIGTVRQTNIHARWTVIFFATILKEIKKTNILISCR